MQNVIMVNGRITGPRSVELDESVDNLRGEVEVILRPRAETESARQSVSAFLRQLPPGTRTRDEIDEQIRQERSAWETRG